MGDTQVDEPDPATIRAAMGGDLAAFESLVRAFQVPVWRFLRSLLGDPELAEDVCQETFLRVYRHLPGFAFQAKFSTWTFQVARNAGIDALRGQARRDRLVADLRVRERSASRHVPEPGLGLELRDAIALLRPKHREALLLVEVLGLTYREAGEVLGAPIGTVKSRAFHAREQVVAWMSAGEALGDDEEGVSR
jgi:RNA polymerase sigma-70 factor, ECF subfamily